MFLVYSLEVLYRFSEAQLLQEEDDTEHSRRVMMRSYTRDFTGPIRPIIDLLTYSSFAINFPSGKVSDEK